LLEALKAHYYRDLTRMKTFLSLHGRLRKSQRSLEQALSKIHIRTTPKGLWASSPGLAAKRPTLGSQIQNQNNPDRVVSVSKNDKIRTQSLCEKLLKNSREAPGNNLTRLMPAILSSAFASERQEAAG